MDDSDVKFANCFRAATRTGRFARVATLAVVALWCEAGVAEAFVESAGSSGVEVTMVVVEPGEFRMGSPDRELGRAKREGPQVTVRFSEPFAVSKTEITVAQFAAFVAATGYETDAERKGASEVFNVRTGQMADRAGLSWRENFKGTPADSELPAIRISWNDAQAFANWLAVETGKPFRLPSESEFEYALRGGTTSPYWWGDGSPQSSVENVAGSRERAGDLRWPVAFKGYTDRFWGPAPVASLAPNPFGLHDMSGNAAEWVTDCFAGLSEMPTDGTPYIEEGCKKRAFRGAAWSYPPPFARSAYRNGASATYATATIGFRVALDLPTNSQSQAKR